MRIKGSNDPSLSTCNSCYLIRTFRLQLFSLVILIFSIFSVNHDLELVYNLTRKTLGELGPSQSHSSPHICEFHLWINTYRDLVDLVESVRVCPPQTAAPACNSKDEDAGCHSRKSSEESGRHRRTSSSGSSSSQPRRRPGLPLATFTDAAKCCLNKPTDTHTVTFI